MLNNNIIVKQKNFSTQHYIIKEQTFKLKLKTQLALIINRLNM